MAKVYVVIDTDEDNDFELQNTICGVYSTYEKAKRYGEDNLESYDIEEYSVE